MGLADSFATRKGGTYRSYSFLRAGSTQAGVYPSIRVTIFHVG